MDYIWGKATQVIDGDTFDMKVSHIGRNNRYEYANSERIRIRGIDAPERGQPGGRRSRSVLAECLAGERLRVDVHARDRYRRVVGDVTIE